MMRDEMEIQIEAVQNACRAAYKKGLIDAAQIVCKHCRRSRPERGRRPGFFHEDHFFTCDAREIIELLDAAGGWQAEWPKISASKT